ncbi:MAG: acylneuraminate cytidylyltransferase family protein [Deferribacteraceae bacterium]|jgi:N-acylneuraminate cytidylyltransferase|nr:acylneuraminate cytidylyltransferase family protein [Deferribacteraceae bacterium]
MNIAFIPVRGGSKSIPLKNIKIINGQPLVYWTAKAASDAACIDQVIIATDSAEIKRVIGNMALPKVIVYDRKPENATDTASTESVILEYLDALHYDDNDNFILIQATSPLLTTSMIDDMFAKWQASGKDSALSCIRTKRFFWNEDGTPINYDFTNRPRRQDFAGMFMENGACYINSVSNILRDKCRLSGSVFAYEMPEETAVEIDEPADWPIVEALLRRASLPTGKTFCFDIDGVLGEKADAKDLGGDYANNTANVAIIAICNKLYDVGNRIVLHTARGSGTGEDWRTVTEKQLTSWGVKYHSLHFGKPAADFYVDDKAMTIDMLKDFQ